MLYDFSLSKKRLKIRHFGKNLLLNRAEMLSSNIYNLFKMIFSSRESEHHLNTLGNNSRSESIYIGKFLNKQTYHNTYTKTSKGRKVLNVKLANRDFLKG